MASEKGKEKEKSELLGYDREAALDITVISSTAGLASRVQDIEYSSGGRRVKALRVEPPFTIPTGRTIFLNAVGKDRASFLPDAEELAERGVASLIVEAPWSDPQWLTSLNNVTPKEAVEALISTAIDVRRGADILTAGRPGSGLAFVGHGIGAMLGGLLSADVRFRALVLIAGVGRFSDLVGPCITTENEVWVESFSSLSAAIDPVETVRTAKFASFLFQLGLEDDTFQRANFVDYFNSAGGSKDLTWYEADHSSIIEVGRPERTEWLDVRIRAIG